MKAPKRFKRSTINELERTWERSREHGQGRDGFHQYLEAVYNSYAELRETKGEAKKARRRTIKWKSLKRINDDTHLISVIIAATSAEDKRTQSRWAQALRYAWKYRERRGHLSLTEFFGKNGGVAGCARKFSNKEKPKF